MGAGTHVRLGLALATVIFGVSLRPATAAAQGCAEGRRVTEQTEGRCCWPGQRWNADLARCEGPPDCPAGWGAAGDQCEPVVRASRLDSPQLVIPEPTSLLIPPESHPDYGLIAAGSIVLFVSYVPTAVLGALLGVWVGGVPVVGGFLWPIWDLGLGLIMGLPLGAVQTLGFVILVYGLATWSESSELPPRAPSFTPDLVAGPGDVGAGLRWTF